MHISCRAIALNLRDTILNFRKNNFVNLNNLKVVLQHIYFKIFYDFKCAYLKIKCTILYNYF